MRTHTITLNQRTYNRVCQQLDFTEKNGNSGRYVVGTKNLYTGVNPSLDAGDADGFGSLQSLIAQAIEDGKSVGGWMDTTTGIYYVDCVAMTNELHVAKTLGHENDELCLWDSHEEVTIDIYKQSSPSEPSYCITPQDVANLSGIMKDEEPCPRGLKGYPFQEGDYYWYEATYHDGTRAIEHGIWDWTSEASHDRCPNQKYYTASEILMKAREQGIPIKTGCN
jgi:hypothetical protein